MSTRPMRLSSRTEVPLAPTPAFCQPSHGALWVAVPPPLSGERPGGLLSHPGGSSDPEGLEQGRVS